MNLKNLYPGRMVSSVYEMDWEKLALTYRGVIFDIDNTLVPHGAPADERACALFAHLKELFKASRTGNEDSSCIQQRGGTRPPLCGESREYISL